MARQKGSKNTVKVTKPKTAKKGMKVEDCLKEAISDYINKNAKNGCLV